MGAYKVGSQSHEGRNAGPRDFNLDLSNLDVVLACPLQDLYGHVEYFRTDVVGDIQRAIRDDSKKRCKPVRVSKSAEMNVGRGCRSSKSGDVALHFLYNAE